jgi:hypothetical protein
MMDVLLRWMVAKRRPRPIRIGRTLPAEFGFSIALAACNGEKQGLRPRAWCARTIAAMPDAMIGESDMSIFRGA